MVIQKFLRGERVLSIDQDKKSSRVSRIQLARETCVATCRGSDALFPESNSGPRNSAGNPAVAVLVSVIGKGLLARISQSGDFSPRFAHSAQLHFLALSYPDGVLTLYTSVLRILFPFRL